MADLASSLRSLIDTVTGLSLAEAEIRAVIGDEKWAALADRLDEARAALAKSEGAQA